MKTIRVTIAIFIVIILTAFLYYQYKRYNFIDNSIRNLTHTERFKILTQLHDDQQWYARISIEKTDGEKIIKMYPFKYGYNPIYIKGKYRNGYIKNKPNCWYYLDESGQGAYSYTLICMSNDKKQIEIYNLFAN